MFEIFVTVIFVLSGDKAYFVSETKYETREACEPHVELQYELLRRRVLARATEEFKVERGCRPVQEGA